MSKRKSRLPQRGVVVSNTYSSVAPITNTTHEEDTGLPISALDSQDLPSSLLPPDFASLVSEGFLVESPPKKKQNIATKKKKTISKPKPRPRPRPVMANVIDEHLPQQYFKENELFIQAINECLQKKRFRDASIYQKKLQENIMFLCGLAK